MGRDVCDSGHEKVGWGIIVPCVESVRVCVCGCACSYRLDECRQ
jgi:hypothetical protein